MKNITTLAAFCALSAAAANAAVTDPVGYSTYPAKAGNNLVVPAFVIAVAHSGDLTGSSASSLTVAADSLTAGAYDAGSSYATHYAEITSGANAGVTLDIASNTADTITLVDDISALSLAGDETFVVRPHITVAAFFADTEASLNAFSDSATFYNSDGTIQTYTYIGSSQWSSDFVNDDGGGRPIPCGTGFVLSLLADTGVVATGEVKFSSTVVQVFGGAVNIVGLTNPLVGSGVRLDAGGFEDLLAFTDTVTVYTQGGALSTFSTYVADGSGNVTSDFINPSSNELANGSGAVISAAADTSIILTPNLPAE